jgi:hypothetical protein
MTAAYRLLHDPEQFRAIKDVSAYWLNVALTLFVVISVTLLLLMAASRWIAVLRNGTSKPAATPTSS